MAEVRKGSERTVQYRMPGIGSEESCTERTCTGAAVAAQSLSSYSESAEGSGLRPLRLRMSSRMVLAWVPGDSGSCTEQTIASSRQNSRATAVRTLQYADVKQQSGLHSEHYRTQMAELLVLINCCLRLAIATNIGGNIGRSSLYCRHSS